MVPAKPSPEERAEIPHHLIDIRDPNEEFSLATYVETAQEKIEEIRGRGREALFVGGTPLYLKGMLRGIFPGPPADWDFRRRVMAEAESVGVQVLHDRLDQVDPLSAARLHPGDLRRIVRALEVHRATGQPISHSQLQFDEGADADSRRVFVIDWPRAVLYERINQRVERMFARGFTDEVERLRDRYGQLSRTASQAVGYRETLEMLKRNLPQDDTVERIKTRTRRFAKRQCTWFRSLSECRRIPLSESLQPSEIAQMILDQGRSALT